MPGISLYLAHSVRTFIDRDGAILLNIQTGRYYSINSVGSRICSALQQGADEAKLTALLTSEYGVHPSIAQNDATQFLALLQRHKLLEQ